LQRIGRYEVIEEIGRGTAAAVYRARDPRLDRTVALKWFPRASVPGREGAGADQREQRAVREARIAASLSHPGIVAVHDVEWLEGDEGGLLIAMEDLQGETVEERLQREGPLSVPEAVSIVRQAAGALAHAHARGVVHRDVKPSNLLLDGEGRVKLADFGIARGVNSDLTREGSIVGTPHYLSPEQARGRPVDGRSDLFSLGAVLYYLLTGERPFSGETVAETLSRILYHDPPPLSKLRPEIGREFDELVEALLSKDPRFRPESAEELERALDRAEAGWTGSRTLPLAPSPPRDRGPALRRLLPWAAGAGALLLVVAVVSRGGSGQLLPVPAAGAPSLSAAGAEPSVAEAPQSRLEVFVPADASPPAEAPGTLRLILAGRPRPGSLTLSLDGRPVLSRSLTRAELRGRERGAPLPLPVDLGPSRGTALLTLRFDPAGGGPTREGSLLLDLEGDEPGAVVVSGWSREGALRLQWRERREGTSSPAPVSSR
jgi:serine/threonine-protein kinase